MRVETRSDREGENNIVDMQSFRGLTSLSPIRQAEAYWSALREGAGIPRRTQIDPRGLENILEYAFILELIAPGIARFRLAGQHLNRAAGMEVRGMPLTAFFVPSARDAIAEALEQVFGTPAIAELALTGEPRFAQPASEAHMIMLPLKSDLGEISRALGVLVSNTRPDRGPARFEVSQTTFRPVGGLRYALPDTSHQDQTLGFAEPRPRGPKPAPTGRPRLRLIKTDN